MKISCAVVAGCPSGRIDVKNAASWDVGCLAEFSRCPGGWKNRSRYSGGRTESRSVEFVTSWRMKCSSSDLPFLRRPLPPSLSAPKVSFSAFSSLLACVQRAFNQRQRSLPAPHTLPPTPYYVSLQRRLNVWEEGDTFSMRPERSLSLSPSFSLSLSLKLTNAYAFVHSCALHSCFWSAVQRGGMNGDLFFDIVITVSHGRIRKKRFCFCLVSQFLNIIRHSVLLLEKYLCVV